MLSPAAGILCGAVPSLSLSMFTNATRSASRSGPHRTSHASKSCDARSCHILARSCCTSAHACARNARPLFAGSCGGTKLEATCLAASGSTWKSSSKASRATSESSSPSSSETPSPSSASTPASSFKVSQPWRTSASSSCCRPPYRHAAIPIVWSRLLSHSGPAAAPSSTCIASSPSAPRMPGRPTLPSATARDASTSVTEHT
mmetsp:Transcript_58063/g.136360  ORF Transcript_58063/g.136360 Transcript_58063/m.136360 type:complete len:203 (-) Transcript_58063:1746-2354(-)